MTAENDDGDKPEGMTGSPKYAPRKKLEIRTNANDVDAVGRAYAEFMTGGPIAALRIMRASEKSAGYEADIDFPALLATLREHGEAVNAGNLQQAEAMLMNQATALQTVFARLVERGMGCTEIPAFEMNLRMGLRAQAQCRATLETLAAHQEPAVRRVRPSGEHRGRAAAGEQRMPATARARGKSKSRQPNFWRRQ